MRISPSLFRIALVPVAGLALGSGAVAEETVKVFILAGQSNMEGKAVNKLFDHQATDPGTRDLFAHLRKDDQWITRDDVMIRFLERHGGLTLGYGSPARTGVELEFGTVLGDHFDEPVLLIKAAWGGHSLVKLFRSPSAGFPADEILQAELENARKQVADANAKNQTTACSPRRDSASSRPAIGSMRPATRTPAATSTTWNASSGCGAIGSSTPSTRTCRSTASRSRRSRAT